MTSVWRPLVKLAQAETGFDPVNPGVILPGLMDTPFNHIVDLSTYPIQDRTSGEYVDLVSRLCRELDDHQVCSLPGFLIDSTRKDEVKRLLTLLPRANPARSYRNVYLERAKDDSFPSDHPKNILSPASYKMMGAHILPEDSALKKLYYWSCFRQFVTDVTGSSDLYPSADPYQPVNVLCHEPGDNSAWHFDSNNAFTLTLTLQSPDKGGVFEMSPNIRSDDNPNYAGLKKLLGGDMGEVRSYEREEGALMLFRGCHSAHRVTEVKGTKPRLMCVMVYENKPGVIGDPVVNETVYGNPNQV